MSTIANSTAGIEKTIIATGNSPSGTGAETSTSRGPTSAIVAFGSKSRQLSPLETQLRAKFSSVYNVKKTRAVRDAGAKSVVKLLLTREASSKFLLTKEAVQECGTKKARGNLGSSLMWCESRESPVDTVHPIVRTEADVDCSATVVEGGGSNAFSEGAKRRADSG